ncbi:MAG: prepilin peptidase [Deltaproteobacteria bacterium]|nr:prepilin peptidase [Deltaproteobacteria bacterium]
MTTAALPGLLMAWAFAVGAAVGSFLNVVIARLPAGESVVRPRSRCPGCRTPIAWYDNLPVLSWILLRGRCRKCRIRISFRYPLVEILGGAAALVAVSRHGLSLAALAEFAFAATLLALSFIDLDTWLLPHVITVPLLAAGLALSALHLTAAPSLLWSAGGAAAGWLSFAAVSVIGEKVMKKEALGFGDVWLLGGLGAWLGLGGLLPVVLLASIQGTVVGLALIVVGRGQPGPAEPAPAPEGANAPALDPDADWVPPRNAVPFGPFLAAGALEWLWLQGWLAKVIPALSLFT